MEKATERVIPYPKIAISLISGLLIGSLAPYLAFSFTDYLGFGLIITLAILTASYSFIVKLKESNNLKENQYLFVIGIFFGIIMLLPYVAIIGI
ncbi:MAG: hypothetical protein ACI33K_09565 [Clostridiaceae bacterium]